MLQTMTTECRDAALVAALGAVAEQAHRPPAPPPSCESTAAELWRELAAADATIAALQDELDGPVLGGAAAEDAAHYAEPLAIYSTPQRWHADGRAGCLVLDWSAPDLSRRLWLDQRSRVLAEDARTAALLAAVLKAGGVTVAALKTSSTVWEVRRAPAA